jgi:hypothetical protein
MYVYVCAEENNFLNVWIIIYFVSEDGWKYVCLVLVVYGFLCLYVVLRKDWWILIMILMFVNPCIIVQFLQWKTQQDATVYQNLYYSLF